MSKVWQGSSLNTGYVGRPKRDRVVTVYKDLDEYRICLKEKGHDFRRIVAVVSDEELAKRIAGILNGALLERLRKAPAT